MDKKNNLLSIIAIAFTMVFLSGCGVNNEIAKEIVQTLEHKDYFSANETFEEASKDLSEKELEKLNSVVSKALKEHLDKGYKEMESDSSKEFSFYNSLDGITNIGIDDKTLDEKIESYRQERAEGNSEMGSETVTTITTEQTEKEGSDKASEYSFQFNTNFGEFIDLVAEVKKRQVELSGVYTKQRYEQISANLKSLMEKYRTEVINVPMEEQEAHEIYLEYLNGEESAMLSFEKAINENNRDVVITETIPYLNSSNEQLLSWGRAMGIPLNN